MPIRLSNTDEWNSHFVRGLKGPYKAFWFWLKSACDCAGVWEIDIDMARMRTGFYDITQDDAETEFKNKIIKLECGEKWYIVGFIEDQHKTTTLNYQNTYHRGVINILAKHGLCDTEFNVLSVQNTKNNKALQRALEDAKGNIKFKVKDKVILNDKDFFKTKEENSKKSKSKKSAGIKIDFEIFWSDYDKKVGKKEKIQSKWDALKMSEQEAILEHIPVYKNQQPDKWFRKDPETYLNNRSWLDEVLIKPENIKSDIVPLNKAHAVLSISNNAKFKGE